MHVMCYDYHGKWDKRTGHNAPLHYRPAEPEEKKTMNVEYSIRYLIKRGALPEKTVLGVPFYGRAFTFENAEQNEIGAAALETAFQIKKIIYKTPLFMIICLPGSILQRRRIYGLQ